MNNSRNDNLLHNLRMLLAERRLSATQLALDLNFSHNRIGDILTESRRIKLKDDELAIIAQYFNVTVETLLFKKVTLMFE